MRGAKTAPRFRQMKNPVDPNNLLAGQQLEAFDAPMVSRPPLE